MFDSLFWYHQQEASASHVQITDWFPQITYRGCFNQFATHYLHYKPKNALNLIQDSLVFLLPGIVTGHFTAALIEILDSFKLQTSLKMKYASVSATGSGVPQQSMYQQTSRQRQHCLNHDLFFISMSSVILELNTNADPKFTEGETYLNHLLCCYHSVVHVWQGARWQEGIDNKENNNIYLSIDRLYISWYNSDILLLAKIL